eukprot:TRINITY_DN1901_c0_g1_i2.p3 TRINITY_DN1901_c0_g1~~TRINITY_DN1901_c0_g1_i2.p3  ORF type:complete len:145 (-),score=26.00 TRINITY_DN1901_c0_g1_i2:8-442(-)
MYAVNVTSGEKRKWNMNANGDDFVSFTALDLAVSADNRFVLVATDKMRLILFHLDPFKQVRNFYGLPTSEMGQVRCCFDLTGQYVYALAYDKTVYVFDVATERMVQRLEGHSNIARDLHHHVSLPLLASCSFDKSMKVWHRDVQ